MGSLVKRLREFFKLGMLRWALVFVVASTVLYFFSNPFRETIQSKNINPEMVVGFISLYTLLFALFQGAKERRFAYKMATSSKFDDMGFLIIANMLTVEMHREIMVGTVKLVAECMEKGVVFKDSNNIIQMFNDNRSESKTAAALDVYFPQLGSEWNFVTEHMTRMSTLATNVVLNYQENDNGKKRTDFLSRINEHVAEIEKLNAELEEKPLEIRNGVVAEINKHRLALADA
jgi:hypothetical protein